MSIGYIFRSAMEMAETGGRFLFSGGLQSAKTGAVFGKPMAGLASGYNASYNGATMFLLPIAAGLSAMAPRGQKAGAAAGVLAAPAASLAAGLIGGPVAALTAAITLDPLLGGAVTRTYQRFAEFGRAHRRLDTGQGFQDSSIAWTMRQRAAQEMGTSLLNAHHILGRESLLMHQ